LFFPLTRQVAGEEKTLKEAGEEKVSLDEEDLYGKIVPPDTHTPKKESLPKEIPGEEEYPKMTFGGYLARYINAVKGDPHKTSSRKSEILNFEKATDHRQGQNKSEKDDPEIETLQTTPLDEDVPYKYDDEPTANLPLPLIPLEETVPITSHETAVLNTNLNLLDTDVPNTDHTPTRPNLDTEPSSPFAKLAMFNLQNLKSGTKSESKVDDTGTQGELINFLLKSGLF
jgi:hypothetical protein